MPRMARGLPEDSLYMITEVQWLGTRGVKSEGPRAWSTAKSWLLDRLIHELTKVTSWMPSVVLVRNLDTSQAHIGTSLPGCALSSFQDPGSGGRGKVGWSTKGLHVLSGG